MLTYKQAVKEAESRISSETCRVNEVRLLLVELMREEGLDLFLEYDQEVNPSIYQRFTDGIERLVQEEPLSYILGYTWFMGYPFSVNQGVLIPRDETEELVGNVLIDIDNYFIEQEEIVVIDVGTGSGAIAISLKLEEPKLTVYASDISEQALKVAKQNAEQNQANITFFVGNMLDPYIEKEIKVDVLLCNPPYIPSEEVIDYSVKQYEPHVALFGGADGLQYYREVFLNAPKVLKEKAMMGFEIGYQQKAILLKEVKEYFPDSEAMVLQDINGKDRMLFVYLNIKKEHWK